MNNLTFSVEPSIYQDLVSFYGEVFHLPPLAAKINSLLIFDFERKGISFEELVDYYKASKSSVSTSLQLLLEHRLIAEKESASRKRYFVTNDRFIRIRFEEIVRRLQIELTLIDRLSDFRGEQDGASQQKLLIYRELLTNNLNNIENSLRQLYDE